MANKKDPQDPIEALNEAQRAALDAEQHAAELEAEARRVAAERAVDQHIEALRADNVPQQVAERGFVIGQWSGMPRYYSVYDHADFGSEAEVRAHNQSRGYV